MEPTPLRKVEQLVLPLASPFLVAFVCGISMHMISRKAIATPWRICLYYYLKGFENSLCIYLFSYRLYVLYSRASPDV